MVLNLAQTGTEGEVPMHLTDYRPSAAPALQACEGKREGCKDRSWLFGVWEGTRTAGVAKGTEERGRKTAWQTRGPQSGQSGCTSRGRCGRKVGKGHQDVQRQTQGEET